MTMLVVSVFMPVSVLMPLSRAVMVRRTQNACRQEV